MEENICVEIVSIIVSAILSIVSIGIAISALYQTKKQIELSNKHKLFDRRLENYLLFVDLLDLYSKSKDKLKSSDDLPQSVIIELKLLTNSVNFVDSFDEKNRSKINYELLKANCNMLKKHSEEASVIWHNEDGNLTSKFIELYANLLIKLMQQDFCIDTYSKIPETTKSITADIQDKKLEEYAESNGLFTAIEQINALYNQIEKLSIKQKLKKTINLKDC